MEFGGADVDIETGEPISIIQKIREVKRAERIISEYQELVNDLSGDGGAILKTIAGLFANRINEIIRIDPECKAYQVIFDDLKIKINVGKALTKIKLTELEKAQIQSL
ncbi:MAG: hypothetical protein Q7J15_08030 [Candidatus Desulfaltia sp.]|nr:hypothetical protein [Candidatus Desulfaltia sp.]